MYNAVNRITSAIVLALMASTTIISCDSQDKRDKAAAENTYQAARDAVESKDYLRAFALMDSIDSLYPRQVQVRREATKLRASAMEGYAQRQIELADSTIAALEGTVNSLGQNFRHIPGGDIPGYYVLTSVYQPSFMDTPTFEARISDDDFTYYVVANNPGKPIGINRIGLLHDGTATESALIPEASGRQGETGAIAIDIATFTLAEASALAAWALDNASTVTGAKLWGHEGEVTVKFSPAQAHALGETWQFAQMASQVHRAKLDRERYEQQLILARDHSANLE